LSSRTGEAEIPVSINFDPSRVRFTGGGNELAPDAWKEMIARGLRAQLVSQSLITGQLGVQLDYFPEAPPIAAHEEGGMIEIPTVPSEIQELKSKLASLPLRSIANAALGSLNSLDTLLRSPDVRAAMKNLSASLDEIRGLIAALTPEVQDTLKQANGTLSAFTNTADQATDTMKKLEPNADASLTDLAKVLGVANEQVGPLIVELRTTARSIDSLAQSAQASLFTGVGVLATRSPVRQNTEETMRNLAAASASLRMLAAELERNPNALILGRSR
jgi:paraquat-inducible protein B